MSNTPITVLIPCAPEKNQIFNLKDYKIGESITLSGLVHRNIGLTLFKTHSNLNEKNIEATKILSYLINPCIIYDVDVFGDCILRIETPSTTMSRREQIDSVLQMIKQSYDEKDSKIVPDDLLQWCKKREKNLSEKALARLRESLDQYGGQNLSVNT